MSTKNSVLIYVLIPVQCLMLFGCDELSGCRYIDGSKGYHEIRQISEVGNSAKMQRFSAFPIHDQIEIYLYSKQCIGEGGDPRIGPYFYFDGEKKIPQIIQRMKTTESVLGKSDLLDALFYINEKCHCIKSTSSAFEDLFTISKEVNENSQVSKDDKEIFNMSFDSLREQVDKQRN